MYLCWHIASYDVNDTQLAQNVNYMQNRKCLPLVIGHYSNTNIHIIMFEAKFSGGPLIKSDISANISVIIVLDLIESGPLFSDVQRP